MVQDCDRAPEFVVASLERVGDDILRWTSRGPYARRGPVGHRRRAGILCKGSLRRLGGSRKHRPMLIQTQAQLALIAVQFAAWPNQNGAEMKERAVVGQVSGRRHTTRSL